MVAYLITFNCYGTHLRGDDRGSVDRVRRTRGGPIAASPELVAYGQRSMTNSAIELDLLQAQIVLESLRATCAFRGWVMLAVHVRSTHVHAVVDGIGDPRAAMRDLKAYASRALNRERKRLWWARGGNTLRLDNREAVRKAVCYVAEK